jgi:uroporphyrinogen decarboxylase
MTSPDTPSRFLQACSGQVPDITPIWLMRQAGRILKPYRDLREKHASLRTLFNTPELAAEITLMPVHMLGVDAAILFTDLVTPLEAMGCRFAYDPGPVFENPVRTREDVERLRPVDTATDLSFVLETIRLVCRELPPSIPLIGYGGSPFTLATWIVEGKGSKDFSMLRRLLYRDPQLAHLLLDKLTDVVIDFLEAQIRAGAQAVQLFDTSVGLLSPQMFAAFAAPYLRRIFSALGKSGVPRIYFPLAGPHLLPHLGELGVEVLSIDWRTDLEQAFAHFSPEQVMQGNLDPCVLYASGEQIVSRTRAILQAARGRSHIFNLGHGILPDTPFDNARLLVDTVHEITAASGQE